MFYPIFWRSTLILSSHLSLVFEVVFSRSKSPMNISRNICTYILHSNVLNVFLNNSLIWDIQEIYLCNWKNCAPKIPHGLAWDWRQNCALRSQILTEELLIGLLLHRKTGNFTENLLTTMCPRNRPMMSFSYAFLITSYPLILRIDILCHACSLASHHYDITDSKVKYFRYRYSLKWAVGWCSV